MQRMSSLDAELAKEAAATSAGGRPGIAHSPTKPEGRFKYGLIAAVDRGGQHGSRAAPSLGR
jgi:hypothetical protein